MSWLLYRYACQNGLGCSYAHVPLHTGTKTAAENDSAGPYDADEIQKHGKRLLTLGREPGLGSRAA